MLDRKQTAFDEKRTLEAHIDEHSLRIRHIESELQQLEPTDAVNAASIHELEDQLVQSEMQLAKHTGSMAALAEEIRSLELDHYALILTRRRFENEALQLNKYSGLQFHSGQRTKSLMHLSLQSGGVGHHATPKRMDRCASALFLPRYVQPSTAVAAATTTTTTPTIQIQYDSSQSMEHSSDGGISSQSGDPLNTSAEESHSPTMVGELAGAVSCGVDAEDDDDNNDGEEEDADQGVCADLPICCRMQALRHKIAYEKATLMKNLEVNSEKRLLDEGIDRLQELQRQHMAFEKRLAAADARGTLCAWHKEAHQDGELLGMASGGGMGADTPLSLSRYRSEFTSRSNLSSCKCWWRRSDGGAVVGVMAIILIAVFCRPFSCAANDSTEYAISVPGYVLCGSGSSAHYEYEITISLDTDKWSIQRRYSRFRELHLAMKRLYGDAVRSIVSWIIRSILCARF